MSKQITTLSLVVDGVTISVPVTDTTAVMFGVFLDSAVSAAAILDTLDNCKAAVNKLSIACVNDTADVRARTRTMEFLIELLSRYILEYEGECFLCERNGRAKPEFTAVLRIKTKLV